MFKLIVFPLLSFVSMYATQNESYLSLRAASEERWEAFRTNREFVQFLPRRSDADLFEEFEHIRDTRRAIWATPGYELAQNLIQADLIRPDGRAAFHFNNTVPYYNASTIYLGDQCHIACEGPQFKDLSKFFELLTSQYVTHLVRLTSAYEGGVEKCHPYWEGRTVESGGKTYLTIPIDTGAYSVQTFQIGHWGDNQGVEPNELLATVLAVQNELKQEESFLAVHCSAGVGRTGTFLAAMAIVEAIDRGQPFSIEEIVYRISLQRISSVARHSQYITLHRLAETYLNQKSNRNLS